MLVRVRNIGALIGGRHSFHGRVLAQAYPNEHRGLFSAFSPQQVVLTSVKWYAPNQCVPLTKRLLNMFPSSWCEL